MDHKWEIHFAEPPPNSRQSVRVTLNNKGDFYLNPVALKLMGDPDAVQVLYDKKKRVIGLVRSSIEKAGVYRLNRKHARGQRAGKMFYANSFCKKFRLFPKETTLFLNPQLDRDGILILDLNQVASAKRTAIERGEGIPA